MSNDKGTCRDCALKGNCTEYKENKSQCEDYESYNDVRTNEERFCSLPTEEKAKWLSNTLYACMRCGMDNGKGYCPFGKCITEKDDALKWLKEKYHE